MLVAVKILHILFAAAWFGHKILIPRDVRQTVHGKTGGPALIQRMARAERLGIVSGLATVLTGVGLILLGPGFADTPLQIYFGLAAALGMFVVGATIARPAWKEIQAGIEESDQPRAAAGVKPFARALLVENILWIVALGSMVA